MSKEQLNYDDTETDFSKQEYAFPIVELRAHYASMVGKKTLDIVNLETEE